MHMRQSSPGERSDDSGGARTGRTHSDGAMSTRTSRVYTEDLDIISTAAALDRTTQSRRDSVSPKDAEFKTFYDRAFSPLTAGGVRQSTFTLVQTALGGGILAMSYMMRLSGLGLGVVLLIVCGIVAIVGMHVIMRSAVELQIFTFSGLLAACMGPKSGIFLDVSLFLYGTGSIITYFIFLGDFIPAIYSIMSDGDIADPENLRTNSLLVTLLVIVPLSLPKELSALRYVSPIALGGILYTTVVVVFKVPEHFVQHDVSEELQYFNVDRNIFRCFSMSIFAYNCHINVVPVAQELVNPGEKRIFKISTRVAVMQFLLYILISCGGYLSFFGKTPANLITAYADADPWILVSRIMMTITMTVNIPVSINPTVRSLLNLAELFVPSLREDIDGNGSASSPEKLKPLLSGVELGMEAPPNVGRDCLRRILAVCCCCMQCWVAIKVTNVAVVIGILGATISTLMMMVIPILLMHVACPDLYPPGRKWCFTLLLSAASVMSLTTLLVS